MKKEANKDRGIAYIEGIFEILTLLNDYYNGREFGILKLSSKKDFEEQVNKMTGKEYKIEKKEITDFHIELENVYNLFCRNYLTKVKELSEKATIEEISKKLNDEFIKRFFISTIIGFSTDSKRIVKLNPKMKELPYKGFIIEFEESAYYLYFEIT